MAVKTYVRVGYIQWHMDGDQAAMYAQVDDNASGETFQADLDAPTEAWLIGSGVIVPAPDIDVTLPVDGTSAGDLPTADGSGSYAWEQPA